jgi:tetratricopeptide (TPR) repeat protein
MIKHILILCLIVLPIASFAQQISYSGWKKQAKNEINMLPEYGNISKNQDQLIADKEFIKTCLEQDVTHRKASDHLVSLGFSYLQRGDIRTAMLRFNQAWLLDNKNENAYWGYGAIYGAFNDFSTAMLQYDKGLAINPESSVILTDKATLYFLEYQRDSEKAKLINALNLLKTSYGIDPHNANTLYKLSICYFLNNDCANAWKYYNECAATPGNSIAEDFTTALKKQCAN